MDAIKIRNAIVAGLPKETSLSGSQPRREWVHIPPAHAKALAMECSLVIGGRGVGKSFWWAALQSEEIRKSLSLRLPDLPQLVVAAGFGEKSDIAHYPDSETFSQLLLGHQPLEVWRAVADRWVRQLLEQEPILQSWEQSLVQVKNDPETFAKNMELANASLRQQGRHALLLFDALDRTSSAWQMMDGIVKDLLRFALWLKPFERLHAKIFLRDDQFEGREIINFPDASKLAANRVDLTWGSVDLHALLWQYLINAPGDNGSLIREMLTDSAKTQIATEEGIYYLEGASRMTEAQQTIAFELLAGKKMGKDLRRGVPYKWIVNHLADVSGRVSPRSFLAAIQSAASDSHLKFPAYELALHYESIKTGVQNASKIRVLEVAEDYPWIDQLMKPLSGLTVPCAFEEMERRWKDAELLEKNAFAKERLPPEWLENPAKGILTTMKKLKIFEQLLDGRINMPDLYRVGFHLGRRGGVRPATRN